MRGAPLEVPTDPDPYVIAGGEGRVSGLLACDADGSCNRHSCCCYLVWEVVPAPSSKPHSANSHTEQWHHRVSQVAMEEVSDAVPTPRIVAGRDHAGIRRRRRSVRPRTGSGVHLEPI